MSCGENRLPVHFLCSPEKSLQLGMAPPLWTYLYICQCKGHTKMTGTLIVE